jgi:hypothetical protein
VAAEAEGVVNNVIAEIAGEATEVHVALTELTL